MADTKRNDPDRQTPGGQPQEKVDDRPMVGSVTPEDYPEDDRETAAAASDKKSGRDV